VVGKKTHVYNEIYTRARPITSPWTFQLPPGQWDFCCKIFDTEK